MVSTCVRGETAVALFPSPRQSSLSLPLSYVRLSSTVCVYIYVCVCVHWTEGGLWMRSLYFFWCVFIFLMGVSSVLGFSLFRWMLPYHPSCFPSVCSLPFLCMLSSLSLTVSLKRDAGVAAQQDSLSCVASHLSSCAFLPLHPVSLLSPSPVFACLCVSARAVYRMSVGSMPESVLARGLCGCSRLASQLGRFHFPLSLPRCFFCHWRFSLLCAYVRAVWRQHLAMCWQRE